MPRDGYAKPLSINIEMLKMFVRDANTQPWEIIIKIQKTVFGVWIALEYIVKQLVSNFDVKNREIFTDRTVKI